MKAREIELGDAFIALRIVKKLGLESLREIVGVETMEAPTPEETEGMTPEEIEALQGQRRTALLNKKAFEVVSYLLTNLGEAETDVLLLLSGWSGTTPEEFKKIKLSELPPLIKEFIAINSSETLTSFFEQAAAALMQR